MAAASMQAIPPPGFAIFPQYIPSTPIKIILKGASFSKSMTASLDNGTPLFTIEGESFSASHRRAVMDATNNSKLFEVRKDGFGVKRYYAEASEKGPRLFETETHTKLLHRPTTTISFANQADAANGSPMVELDFSPAGMGKDGSFMLNGQPVVLVEKISVSMAGEYHLSIVPGLDPALVVGVMIAMIDRAKTQSTNAGVAGANASVAAG